MALQGISLDERLKIEKEILDKLLVEVKPHGAVWCDHGLRIRYLPYGEPIRITWQEAAALVGIELPKGMTKKQAYVRARLMAVRRKPVQREDMRATPLTPERIAEAKREAREWGERRGLYTKGLGEFTA